MAYATATLYEWLFFLWRPTKRNSEILTGRRSGWRSGLDRFDFFEGLGHDVPGLRWQAGAFKLHGGVADAKFVGYFFLNVRKNAFALIEVHIRDACMQAKRVVRVSQRPNMHVVNLLHAGHGEDGARYVFHAHALRTPFQQNVGGLPQNSDAGPQHQQANRDAQQRVDPT